MTVTSSRANRPLAIVHGSPFPNSADVPSSLTTALLRAAKTKAGIRYLEAGSEADGTETVQSYAELLSSAMRVAIALHARGLGKSLNRDAAERNEGKDFVILEVLIWLPRFGDAF